MKVTKLLTEDRNPERENVSCAQEFKCRGRQKGVIIIIVEVDISLVLNRVAIVRVSTMMVKATSLVSRKDISLANRVVTSLVSRVDISHANSKAAISPVLSKVAIVHAIITTTMKVVISLVLSKVAIVHAIITTIMKVVISLVSRVATSLVLSRAVIAHVTMVAVISLVSKAATSLVEDISAVAIVSTQPTTIPVQSIA